MASFPTKFLFSVLIFYYQPANYLVPSVSSVLGFDPGVFEARSSILNQSSFGNVPLNLGMDQAYLNVSSSYPEFLEVHGISANCYKCPLLKLDPVFIGPHSKGFIMDTRWRFKLQVSASADKNKNCSMTFHFGEGGRYTYQVVYVYQNKLSCAIVVNDQPRNSYIPILVAAAVLVGLALFVIFIKWLRRRYLRCYLFSLYSGRRLNSDLGTPSQTLGGAVINPAKKRLQSLDAFRGLALVIMVFVNFGGGGYWFFQHSIWNGLTVADLVFPWFIFIMGVSIALSLQSLVQKNVRKINIFGKIVRRTLILFALGLLINHGTDLNYYRIPGVLQRFSFSYFVVASLELFLPHPTEGALQTVWWFTIREIIQLWKQWIVMFCLLAVYLILTFAVKVPGCSTGYIGPGGIGEGYPDDENCTGGMAGYIDRKFFGENHIYGNPTSKKLYHGTVPYDPEGALGSITSAFLTFLGLQAGKILVVHKTHIERERRMISWALILGFIAVGLCGASKNEGVIPLNKNLWSLSFVLATGAMAYVLLTFCYFTIDDMQWWNGTPFIFPGMNSILVYCGHEVLASFFPFNWELHSVTHAKKLAMNMWGASAWVIIAYYCYKIDFFVKI